MDIELFKPEVTPDFFIVNFYPKFDLEIAEC